TFGFSSLPAVGAGRGDPGAAAGGGAGRPGRAPGSLLSFSFSVSFFFSPSFFPGRAPRGGSLFPFPPGSPPRGGLALSPCPPGGRIPTAAEDGSQEQHKPERGQAAGQAGKRLSARRGARTGGGHRPTPFLAAAGEAEANGGARGRARPALTGRLLSR